MTNKLLTKGALASKTKPLGFKLQKAKPIKATKKKKK